MEQAYRKIIKPELLKLIDFCQDQGIAQMELELNNFTVNFSRGGELSVGESIAEPSVEEIPAICLNADRVGVFHFSSPENPITKILSGETVKKDQLLGFIETLSLYYELTAPCDGKIKQIAVKEDEIVEFGKTLMELIPAAN